MVTVTAEKPAPPEASVREDKSFFGHPRGLATLFGTEVWERFSYYGMRAILILFMTAPIATGGLGFDTPKAGAIYGIYTSMVYLLSLPGGWIADRFLGARKSVLYGGMVITFGHVCLAFPVIGMFYLGLCLIVLGTGLLKPNISTMVGQLYSEKDERRDAAFSIFYMGINIGAFISPLIVGWLAQGTGFRSILEHAGIAPENAWHFGFASAAVGMFFGVVQYALGGKHLGHAGLHAVTAERTAEAAGNRKMLVRGIGLTLGAIALLAVLGITGVVELTVKNIADGFGWFLLLVVIGSFAGFFLFGKWTPDERKRLVVILILFIASGIFWAGFEQAGSTLNLFAENNTNNSLFGFDFPASWLQSPQALFIVILAPAFAWLWVTLGRHNPTSPAKFALGLLGMGLGFAILVPAAGLSTGGAKVGPIWLIATYLLHTFGELCLSPVGLSAYTRLAPARVASLMMGVWFLSISVGDYIGGRIAGLYESFSLPSLFGVCAATGIGSALCLAFMVKPIQRMLVAAESEGARPAKGH
jgi:proton-dependent oligopeptide transporter, POT family